MKTKFHADTSSGMEIREVRVASETLLHVVTRSGIKIPKLGFYEAYCDTREEAERFVIEHFERALKAAKDGLADAQKDVASSEKALAAAKAKYARATPNFEQPKKE